MPACFAAVASCLPTSFACAVFVPLKLLGRPFDDAEASVLPVEIVDELRVDADVRAEDGEARPLGRPRHLAAHAAAAARSGSLLS